MAVSKYFQVDPDKFINHEKLPCDVYIKLGPRKFVKVIKQNTEYNKEIILKYKSANASVFHVTENGLEALNQFETNLLKKLSKAKDLPLESAAAKNLWSVQLMQDQVRNLGVTEVVIEATDAVIKDTINSLKQENRLQDLINSILRKNDYIVEHSLMISYIAIEMCQRLKWNNQATYEKISLAALIHDCNMEDALHAQLDSKEMILDAPISEAEKKHILSHPQEIAKMVQQAKRFIPDVDKIVLEHHERPDGSGFPFGITGTKIHPLSCLFIMTEDFVNTIYNSQLSPDLIKKLRVDFEKTYNSGNFRKVLEVFLDYFDEFLNVQPGTIKI